MPTPAFSPATNNSPSAILPLSRDAIAQIKSSTTITSLTGVVFGLLENALDAQATKVDITVDFRRGGCTIEDNGLGILPSEFREEGGLGHMHYTSKQISTPSSELHGGSGTFLASLSALSLLTVTSHHHQHYSHNTLVMHRTKPIGRLTPSPAQYYICGFSHGTRVTVRDLFGNMPVRVKQRAMTANEPLEIERYWQTLKRGIVALLLPWRAAIVVKISDAEDRSRSFSITSNTSSASRGLSEKDVNALERKVSTFNQRNIVNVLAQAGYTSIDVKDRWVAVSASSLFLTVRGLISREPAPSRATQFISIGIAPCTDESGHHELYDIVNRKFDQSSFGRIEDDSEPDEIELERRKHDRRYKRNGPTNRKLRGGGKGVDRWPRFCFCIELKQDDTLVGESGSVRTKDMVDILEALATQWLETNNFRPRNGERKKGPMNDQAGNHLGPLSSAPSSTQGSRHPLRTVVKSPAPGFDLPTSDATTTQSTGTSISNTWPGSPSPLPQTPFTDWSRIKSGKPAHYNDLWKCNSPLTKPNTPKLGANPLVISVQQLIAGELGSGSSTPPQEPDTTATVIPQVSNCLNSHQVAEMTATTEDELIEWTNPTTKQKCRINARTGVVLPETQYISFEGTPKTRQPAALNTGLSAHGRPLSLQRRLNELTDRTASPWLENVFEDWRNPTFTNQVERAIPVAAFDGPGHEHGDVEHHCSNHDIAKSFLQTGKGSTSRLSKETLLDAQVISQVDQKFILLKTSNSFTLNSEEIERAKHLLVLIDQHAASERCILEGLFSELCRPIANPQSVMSALGHVSRISTVKLDKALLYQVSKDEGLMFKAKAAHFARWGILYNITQAQRPRGSDSDSRLSVITLPPGISERCKTEPKLVIEILRSEIYTTAETPSSTSHDVGSAVPIDPHFWLRQIGSCPKGIINMLNSRACRSAIMFNDKLSTMECRELVKKLAVCAFPFMCAHGRVSMVPVVDLDGQESGPELSLSSVFEHGKMPKKEQGFADAFRTWRTKAKDS